MDELKKRKIYERLSKEHTCHICGCPYKGWNVTHHKKSQRHKMMAYCKKKMVNICSKTNITDNNINGKTD